MKTQPTQTPSTTGFTRIDLIVVVAIVALLAPLVMGSTRQHGQSATCLDNFRRLTLGWLMYAADHRDLVPPNPDDGNNIPGHNWCPGNAGRRGPHEFNPDLLVDPQRSMLVSYVGGDGTLFRCPADERRGTYQGTDPARLGTEVPAARSVAMNLAVGTVCPQFPGGHSGAPVLRTHAPWLDNNHGHTRNGPFRTYGKLGDFVDPGPARTWVLIDEDADSLNDGNFAVGMLQAEWIDWPGTRHDVGATISYADGRAEIRKWVDSRTVVINGNVARRGVSGSEDYEWLRDRTSARIRP